MAILFTPPAPRSKNTLLTTVLLLATLNLGKTQDLTLQPLPRYEASLRQYHTQRRDAARDVYISCAENASVLKKWIS